MNYIAEINSFWDSVITNPLSTGQVSLYFALMHVNNRSSWTEWFAAPNQVLSILTGMSRSGILKARNELKQRGYIDFKDRGTRATLYRMLTMSNSTQDSVQNSNQYGMQNGNQDSVRNSGTLYKHKQNETETIPPIAPTARFGEFYSAYPKPCNRYLAETEYCKCVSGGAAETDMVDAAANYAQAMSILGKEEGYIKNPENFLRDRTYVDYLPGNYIQPRKPERKTGGKFNDMMQGSYDFEELERELTGN